MHLRFSTCRGMRVVDSRTGEGIGIVSSPLINPDTGHVAGVFVDSSGLLRDRVLFITSHDVGSIGQVLRVRGGMETLSSAEDIVRLRPLLTGKRRILGQKVRTEEGRALGRCRDIQFDTMTFLVEWLFPRRFLRWGSPIPVSDIVEVKEEAIVVRDPLRLQPVGVAEKAPVFA